MASIDAIPIPLPHIGSVNAWLLRGDPLTLVDTGPRSDLALDALERGLRLRGLAIEDVELVIGTHHHHDHVGLAATIKRRSGARIAVLEPAAEYSSRYLDGVERDRSFARALMRAHGVPEALFGPTEDLWDYIASTAESFDADVSLQGGDRIRAGGRWLDVVARPGHSKSDTMFVDKRARVAFSGDHLLAKISPNTEIYELAGGRRSRSRPDYLVGLKRTARMTVDRFLPGHGPAVVAGGARVRRELEQHRRRCRRILGVLADGPADAFSIGRKIWNETIVREQPLLVVWEVLGHLDLLRSVGIVDERPAGDGRWRYGLVHPREDATPQARKVAAHAG